MPEEFDREAARRQHDEIIDTVRRVREVLSADVIDYYYNRYPETEEEQREQQDGMRRYLKIAYDRIYDLMNGKLYH